MIVSVKNQPARAKVGKPCVTRPSADMVTTAAAAHAADASASATSIGPVHFWESRAVAAGVRRCVPGHAPNDVSSSTEKPCDNGKYGFEVP